MSPMDEADDREARIAELAEAYLEGLRQGNAQSIDTYADEHPDEAEELRELLPAMVEVEGLSMTTRPHVACMTAFPESLGGYKILERIGCGGMGAVFRAMQESLHREVAIKILSPAWNADAHHCAAFEQESQVIARLRHTNIVEIYGAGQEGDYRYYVMSLVRGQGVTPARIRKAYPGVPYERAVAQVGLQAAQALAFAHSQGVLHRDVKPGNLLLDDEGVVHVGDFGLATVLNSGEAAPLVTQSHDGTLRYMAPERLTRGENSFSCDQYALGLTLYELLTNRAAFKEVEPGALIRRICEGPIEPLRGEGELGAVINKAVSFEPADRYATMQAMAEDLQRYLDGVPVAARPTPLLRRYAMWWRRRPAVAVWSHLAGATVALLFISISIGYASVRHSLARESEQRLLAEQNARIADASLQRIFGSMMPSAEGGGILQATKADARLLQDLMPYYEEILARGDDSDGKMANACTTLAVIALQTGEYSTAEEYFSRAAKLLEKPSLAHLRALNGLLAALSEQRGREKGQAAAKLVQQALAMYGESSDFEQRLELVRLLQQVAMPHRGPMAGPMPGPKPGGALPPGGKMARGEAFRGRAPHANGQRQAVLLLAELLKEQPDHLGVRLAQVEMLEGLRQPEWKALLAPNGETVSSLLEQLLRQAPENELVRRAYLHFVMSPENTNRSDRSALEKASAFACALLADHPTDTELLMQYLTLRDLYAAALVKEGKKDEAANENARTLGVLSLLTARADFSPEMRERLAMLVSLHPEREADQTQRDAEISLLLQSHDEQKLQQLRERVRRMREQMPHHGFRPAPRKN